MIQALILPVVTTTVEKAFSDMDIEYRINCTDRMKDEWTNYCLFHICREMHFNSIENETTM